MKPKYIVNDLKTLGKDTIILAGTAGAGYAVKNSPKAAQLLAAPVNALANLAKSTNTGKFIAVLPAKYKAAIAAGTAALTALFYQSRNNAYQAGQIDQKYTDLAKIEQQGRNIPE